MNGSLYEHEQEYQVLENILEDLATSYQSYISSSSVCVFDYLKQALHMAHKSSLSIIMILEVISNGFTHIWKSMT